ncbi:MAG: helix-turn-helix domain-containing protein [Alphaproteobacteria bacterium]|nr:helix-turn-helix domain-containing protein [Alphaproteobacteria bacterium]
MNAGRRRKQTRDGARVAVPDADPTFDVVVVLLDGGYASTGIAPVEIFASAGVIWNWFTGEEKHPRFRVNVASLDGRNVQGMCGLAYKTNFAIDEVKKADIVLVSASSWSLHDGVAKNAKLKAWLRKWHAKGAYVVGICTAVAFLAESGLLDGRVATTHWGVADLFRQTYPKVRWQTDRFVTEDDRVLCSGGVYAAVDVSLYLVEKFCGREVALQCAKSLCLSMPRSSQAGYAAIPQIRVHSDEKIRSVEEYVRANFARDLSIAQLARRASMGERNFIRRFKAATGFMPGNFIRTLRVAAAKELLEADGAAVQVIAERVGYSDHAFFRRLFKRQTGMTPGEYRGRFARLTIARTELARGPAGAD